MKPLSEFPQQELQAVRAVLTDIDDTLTDEGRLPACSYQAMEDLRNAGILVVPVTGRPAGWCDLIARQWPVDGVVGENGAHRLQFLLRKLRKRLHVCKISPATCPRMPTEAAKSRHVNRSRISREFIIASL